MSRTQLTRPRRMAPWLVGALLLPLPATLAPAALAETPGSVPIATTPGGTTVASTTSAVATEVPAPRFAPGKGQRRVSPRLRQFAGESTNDPASTGLSGGGATTARGDASGLPESGPGSLLRRGEGVIIGVRLAPFTPDNVAAVLATGATKVAEDEPSNTMSVVATPSQVLSIESVPAVQWVEEELAPFVGTSRLGRPAAGTDTVPGAPAQAVPAGGVAAVCPTGIVSEGDQQLNAASARSQFGITGSGVTVGVLSDSYNALGGANGNILAAELPGTGNPCGNTQVVNNQGEISDPSDGSDEGRAMMQIVHDLAPGANLMFGTASDGQTAFANKIRQLRSAGSQVIVDDIGYLTEPDYQGGPITTAIEEVAAQGVNYYSAAGNSNIIINGQNVGGYEAPNYRAGSCPSFAAPGTLDCHATNGTAGYTFTLQAGGQLLVKVGWNERQGDIRTDLDLYLIDTATGLAADYSTADNFASGTASELVFITNDYSTPHSYKLVIGRFEGSTGAPRLKATVLDAFGLFDVNWEPYFGDTIGSTLYGHGGAPAAESIAAIPYNNAQTIEEFSSRGPQITCWDSVGAAGASPFIRNPCVSSTIDLAATDGTANSFFGRNELGVKRFYGTSAAAPHAAAVAALVRSYRPGCTAAQYGTAIRTTAQSMNGFPVDARGAGRIDAAAAVAAAPGCLPGTSITATGLPTALRNSPTPVHVQVRDSQGRPATNYSGSFQLSSTSPGMISPVSFSLTGGYGVGYVTPLLTGSFVVNVQGITSPSFTSSTGSISVAGADRFHSLTPTRLLDSRPPPEQVGPYGSPWGPNITRDVQVTGGAVPANADAVLLNVTVTGTTAASFLSIWPSGQPKPLVSSLNWSAGQTIPNAVTAKVGVGGKISVFNPSGDVNVIVDLVGYYDANGGDGYTGVAPARILDSRPPPEQVGPFNTPWSAGQSRHIVVISAAGVPTNATAVVANVTVTGASASSFLTLWPAGQAKPLASSLNFSAGQTIANAVTVKVGAAGAVSVFNNSGNVNVLIDVVGYFTAAGGSGFHPLTPLRALDSRPDGPQVGPYGTAWGAGTNRTVGLGVGSVPSTATAVLTNTTVTGATAASFLTVWPSLAAQPTASSVNWGAGVTIANAVTTAVSTGTQVRAFNNSGNVHVIIDVSGWYG